MEHGEGSRAPKAHSEALLGHTLCASEWSCGRIRTITRKNGVMDVPDGGQKSGVSWCVP